MVFFVPASVLGCGPVTRLTVELDGKIALSRTSRTIKDRNDEKIEKRKNFANEETTFATTPRECPEYATNYPALGKSTTDND